MDDIISQGGDRGPMRPGRRVAVIAIIVVLGALLVVRHLPHGLHAVRSAHQPPSTPRVVPEPAASLQGPGGTVPGSYSRGLFGSATTHTGRFVGIAGPTRAVAGGLRLPATGEKPAWFWPRTGRRQLIGGLPANKSGYVFTRVGDGWAVQAGEFAAPGCGDCAGPPQLVYFLPDGAPAAIGVGTANQVAPAATPGAIWLTAFPGRAPLGSAEGSAQEVSSSGAAIGHRIMLPVGYAIERGTTRGLLLAPVTHTGRAATDELWSPAGFSPRRTFSGVIAASAGQIAWTSPCASTCMVHVLNLAKGHETVIDLPRGNSAASGAFSQDGKYLALQVSFGDGGNSGALAMQLEVASTVTGSLTVVPGTWASSDALVGFGWPSDSHSLVAELSFTTKVQLASWHPGSSLPAVAVVGPREDPVALITG